MKIEEAQIHASSSFMFFPTSIGEAPKHLARSRSWYSLMTSMNKYVTEEKRVTHTTATELQGYKFHISLDVLLQIFIQKSSTSQFV
jgi:hypothetical protein